MKDYTITLTKILGKEKYKELVDYSFNMVKNKFIDVKTKRTIEIANVNHQAIMIIAILKAKGIDNEEIIETLRWNKKKAYKYIVVDSFDEFVSVYKEYIDSIVQFLKNN